MLANSIPNIDAIVENFIILCKYTGVLTKKNNIAIDLLATLSYPPFESSNDSELISISNGLGNDLPIFLSRWEKEQVFLPSHLFSIVIYFNCVLSATQWTHRQHVHTCAQTYILERFIIHHTLTIAHNISQ